MVAEGSNAPCQKGVESAVTRYEHFRGSPLTLTAKDVAEIMRLLDESSFESLSLEIDGVKLSLQRNSARTVSTSHDMPWVPPVAATELPRPTPQGKTKAPSEPGLAEVRSPL